MSASPTVVILAAGQGTRMRSATPKVLHELCGIPMVLWPIRAALAAGAGRVVVVDSPARAIEPVLPDGIELAIQAQSDGTGGAVRAASELIDPAAPVVILSGDVPLVSPEAIAELVQAHSDSGAAATMATAVLDDPTGYGRVVRDADGSVARVVETKKPGDAAAAELEIREVNSGIYVFSGAELLGVLPRLTAENAQREFYLPQTLDLLRSDGALVAAHVVDDERLMLGVNDRVALAHVRALAQRSIAERHMRDGVTIVDPASTVIDVDVTIGQDTVIEPGTSLKGSTVVGARAVVGPSTTAIDSRIGDGACVRVSWLSDCNAPRRRERRPVRLPAPRRPAARGLQGRHVRGDQELGYRGKRKDPAPVLHRRRGRGPRDEPRRRHHHRQLRRSRQAPHRDRRARAGRCGHLVRRARSRSATTHTQPPARSSPRMCRPAALAVARARQKNLEGYAQRRASQPTDAPEGTSKGAPEGAPKDASSDAPHGGGRVGESES